MIEELEELLKWNSQQIICNEIVLLFNMQIQSILTIRLSEGFHVPIMESSHHCCQRFFIFDERLPVLVSVFVHLQEIRKCIVRQVIVKIAITGHRPRSIRHIERGHDCCACSLSWAIFFPFARSFYLLALTIVPDRWAWRYVCSVMRS